MQRALRTLGKNWYIRNYPKTEAGYKEGLTDIKHHLVLAAP
jgi:hypothetical protein